VDGLSLVRSYSFKEPHSVLRGFELKFLLKGEVFGPLMGPYFSQTGREE